MLKKLAIGVSDFKKLIQSNCYFVDKSLLIKEFLDDGAEVVLLPRPRRFGKTLNLSMLSYYFDLQESDNLFTDLAIWQHEEYREFRGKYPVIFLTLKDTKADNYDDCIFKIKEIIREELQRFEYLLTSDLVNKRDILLLNRIASDNALNVEYESFFRIFLRCIAKHHGVKPILLIDEYDVPIQAGFSYGYYDKIISFMRNFLTNGLKDSKYLHKAALTGILRVAKESIFSGLNNPKVATIIDIPYSDKFGLKEDEVTEMLKYYNMEASIDIVKEWYDGYIFGNTGIYNPWSILSFIDNKKPYPEPYWINTSSNDIIKSLISRGSGYVKEDLEILISGETITKEVNSSIVMSDIEKSPDSLWTFLLFSGYLTALKRVHLQGSNKSYYELAIPNTEVSYIYEAIISSWIEATVNSNKHQTMLKSLLSGDIKTFNKIFSEYCLSAFSYFDVSGETEKTYHAFVLGMLISLPKPDYQLKSNRESGLGRYDVMIIPKDTTKKGIIIEFKKFDAEDEKSIEDAIESAFTQIEEKKYRQELLDLGFAPGNILEVAIAIDGKASLVKARNV